MKDKLQEIEMNVEIADKFHGEITSDSWLMDAINRNDVLWLINQVKTLQEKLLLETEALEEQYELSLIAKKKIEQYEKALEFYADEDNYFKRVIPPVIESNVVTDKGEVARKALKELTND
jgi:DNA-binding SARP family transcriptional activator